MKQTAIKLHALLPFLPPSLDWLNSTGKSQAVILSLIFEGGTFGRLVMVIGPVEDLGSGLGGGG